MEQSASERLPQELVDDILDKLHDEQKTLRSCALVCGAWLPSSRRHLFAKICLKATSPQTGLAVPQERCERLYKLLQRTPSIIPYIRELEICEGSPLHHYNSHVQGSTTWVTTERSLAALFRMLTHVQRFEFSAISTLYWTLLPPTFQSALCTLLAQPSLTYLRMHSWMFPSFAALRDTLAHCKNLRAFALSSTNVSGSDAGPELGLDAPTRAGDNNDGTGREQQRYRTPLEVLTLDYVTFAHIEQWLLGHPASVDIRYVRELRVAHCYDAEIVKKLLLNVAGSLEHFHFKPGSWNGESLCTLQSISELTQHSEAVNLFDLSYNPGLQSIRLTLDVTETAMDWALAILSSISSANTALSSIGLEFFADPKRISRWGELDALFMGPSLEGLRQVEIGLFASLNNGADFAAVKHEMRNLDARGIVRWYQLGLKSQRSSRQLTPRISQYES